MITSKKIYVSGFDAIRVFAAFSVVWIHGCVTSTTAIKMDVFNQYAVPVFIAISFFLYTQQLATNPKLSFSNIITSKFQRLMIPYFIWTIIYLLIRLFKSSYIKDPIDLNPVAIIFFRGTSYQLWFLPNLFYLSILFFPLIKYLMNKQKLFNAVFISIAAAALIIRCNVRSDISEKGWFERHAMLYVIPSLIPAAAGVFLYYNYKFIKRVYTKLNFTVSLFILCIIFFSQYFIDQYWIIMLFTVLLLLFFTFYVQNVSPALKRISVNSMGIYLAHGVFLEGIKTFLKIKKVKVQGLTETFFLIVATYFASLILSDLLSRKKFLKKYLLGN